MRQVHTRIIDRSRSRLNRPLAALRAELLQKHSASDPGIPDSEWVVVGRDVVVERAVGRRQTRGRENRLHGCRRDRVQRLVDWSAAVPSASVKHLPSAGEEPTTRKAGDEIAPLSENGVELFVRCQADHQDLIDGWVVGVLAVVVLYELEQGIQRHRRRPRRSTEDGHPLLQRVSADLPAMLYFGGCSRVRRRVDQPHVGPLSELGQCAAEVLVEDDGDTVVLVGQASTLVARLDLLGALRP